MGCSAALSFESLDVASCQWINVIKASETDIMVFGLSGIGDVGNDIQMDIVNNKSNHFLPSTQTGFRAKLVVTGNLNIGVSITMVA